MPAPHAPRSYETESLIFGAGGAGVEAGRVLADNGRSAIILEAGDGISGRIRTIAGIEHGAEFIHGLTDDFSERLNRYDLHADPYDLENAYVFAEGKLRPMNEMPASLTDIISVLRTKCGELIESGYNDTTTAAFFRDMMIKNPEWKPMERLIRRAIQNEYGAPLHELSLTGFKELSTYEEKNYRMREGYSELIERMAEGLDIRTSTPVLNVKWGESGVAAETPHGIFRAEKAIITVPLGVLQQGKPRFTPSLPEEKLQAITKLGSGRVWKIILECRERIWPKDMELLCSTTPSQTWWPGPVNNGQPPSMIALVGGKDVDNFEHSTQYAANVAVRDFERMLGRGASNVIENIDVIAWSDIPHIRMGYSFVPPFAPRARKTLAEPVEGKLFFAGEATSSRWPGTVHGALESGKRAAFEAMNVSMSPLSSSTDTPSAAA